MISPDKVVDVTTVDTIDQKMFSDVWQVLLKQRKRWHETTELRLEQTLYGIVQYQHSQ